jgi:hypothetical protein
MQVRAQTPLTWFSTRFPTHIYNAVNNLGGNQRIAWAPGSS